MKFTLSIPQPCSENWERMTPSGCGRHCAACDKVVIDFTEMSNKQIGDLIAQRSAEKLCGRFHPVQLEEEYTTPVPPSIWQYPLRWLAAAMLIFSSLPVYPENAGNKVANLTVQSKILKNNPPFSAGKFHGKDSTRIICITVVDPVDKSPLPLVTINFKIQDSTAIVITDSAGVASIKIPNGITADSLELQIQSVGYFLHTRKISLTESTSSYVIELYRTMLGGLAYTVSYEQSWKTRLRRFFTFFGRRE